MRTLRLLLGGLLAATALILLWYLPKLLESRGRPAVPSAPPAAQAPQEDPASAPGADDPALQASLARLEALKRHHEAAQAPQAPPAPTEPSALPSLEEPAEALSAEEEEAARQAPVDLRALQGDRPGLAQAVARHPESRVLRMAYLRTTLREAKESAAKGYMDETFSLLDEARRGAGGDTELRKAVADVAGLLAMAQLRVPEPDRARRLARWGVECDQAAPEPRVALGQLAYEANDLEGAIHEWEHALRLAPEEPGLHRLLEKARREQQVLGRFRTHSSAHFVLTFDGGEDREAAELALTTLERAYEDVGKLFNFRPEERVPVVLYPQRTFSTIDQAPSWAGGLYDGKVRVPTQGALSRIEEFRSVLVHEYTHALFHRVTKGRPAPAWLNEGLAQVAEGAAPIPCSWGHGVPLGQLERSFTRLNAAVAQQAYRTSQHAVERLLARHGWSGVRALLDELAAGRPFPEAFSRALSRDGQTFLTEFDKKETCR